MAAPIVNLLRLSGFPLLRQLWLEEALFRSHPGNWFVINDGVPDPTIVLGISGYVYRQQEKAYKKLLLPNPISQHPAS